MLMVCASNHKMFGSFSFNRRTKIEHKLRKINAMQFKCCWHLFSYARLSISLANCPVILVIQRRIFFSVPQQQSIRYDFIWCYQANHRITCICHICAMKNAWQNHTIKIITESLAVADKENAIYKIRWIFWTKCVKFPHQTLARYFMIKAQ